MTQDGALELWGGVECTVNRVGEKYFDQVRKSGHHDRPEDIARLAAIGLRAVRYPVLWERVAPDGLSTADWTWTDERLALLRGAGILPVATLLHHGSGPRNTHLLDPAFPESFAAYAAAVATRYPWLQDYTPVNEPLTTARFSALYGHWYPHHRDDRSFVRALLHELRATVLGMARIREINPCARLIQTEDAGRTYSSPRLVAQAEFENHRRWLTVDVLAGRVSENHPLWNWLVQRGASPTELHWFLDHPCPPDVVGLNYYLTSDRYLDERLAPYPASSLGGNGRDCYADVEAVRVSDYDGPAYGRILDEAWTRYALPIALTEVHAGCTREDQLRWFVSAWQAASAARNRGVDVRAVTMWSLLGSFDWNSLVTRDDNVYEVGTFDVRSAPPRRTALGTLAQALATGTPPNPLASQPGWWQRVRRATESRIYGRGFCRGRRRPPDSHRRGHRHARFRAHARLRGPRIARRVGRSHAARYHEPGRDPASAGSLATVGRDQRGGVRARGRCRGDPRPLLARQHRRRAAPGSRSCGMSGTIRDLLDRSRVRRPQEEALCRE